MLSLDELRAAHIHAETAREALRQVDQRLADTLDTKKAFEQKAATLFAAYVAISLALFGIAGTLFKSQGGFSPQASTFALSGFLFLVGAILFVFALLDKDYGARGSSPGMWLQRGVIDGDDRGLATMLAYLTYYHRERIEIGVANNETKAKLTRWGVKVGVATPFLLLLLLVLL